MVNEPHHLSAVADGAVDIRRGGYTDADHAAIMTVRFPRGRPGLGRHPGQTVADLAKPRAVPRPKIALVASSGGHLAELYALRDLWGDADRFWVSFPTQDAEYLLSDEKVVWAAYPTNRNVPNLVRNWWLALRVLRRKRPDVVISTGAGVGVPFLWAGRLFGMRTVYVESITRLGELSMSGRLVYPVVDKFLVQWESLVERYPKAEYWGQVV